MPNILPDTVLNRRRFLFDSGRLLVMISSLGGLACACGREKEGESQLAELVIEQGRLVLDLNDSRYHALNTIGNGVKIEITRQEKPLIITRVSETLVAAFSSQCPHAGYEILLPEQGVMTCSSGHGGVFDLEGRVLAGPPKSNLSSRPAQLLANRLYVTLFG